MNTRAVGSLFFRSQRYASGVLKIRHHCAGQPQDELAENIKFKPGPTSKYDWIGPPDRLSNLRPIIYHIPENETQLERRLRHLRQETEDWNHEFWKHQNVTFSKEKEEYVQSQLKAKGLTARDENGRRRTLSSEEMAVFYKYFLDRNYKNHESYNKEWYRRNFTITILMAKVALHNLRRTLTGQARSKSKPTAMPK
ncbi:cytochrome c oxidase assembly factor 8 [Astyanax mexicanus]|uniref:Apoptogenic protein 1, mitochondrial n=2 Tax=Astyanax mexicanus TaxID=7994 RepID=A0A8B9KUJ8_ASTMX|nr:cytochrome c oxidase assembly factor 8 [Astyanax mexicanus]KAG9275268.1 apoptogenic protein 1, mitochondrial [Astyanax mexicanus]